MNKGIIVNVEDGQIRGQLQEDYHGGKFFSFSGIPYAKPPIGDLRFKAPEPCEPWAGIKDGTREGPVCPSRNVVLGSIMGREDNCLNLNVYTKELPMERKVKNPVMVFIHGGGFLFGSNRSIGLGPQYLLTENIVLVVPNYRLGVLGFLSLEDQSLGVPGNAGLKDQAFALKWVQKNIHNFGGDPDNVTLFGESAGSASAHYLTLSPLTKGLFHKVILQSGTALNIWARGRRNGFDIDKAMRFEDKDEKAILGKLRESDVKNLLNCQFRADEFSCLPRTFSASQVLPFGPVIEYPHEGAFLSEDPEEIIKSGRSHQIPIIMGYNSMEGILFGILRKRTGVTSLPSSTKYDVPYDLNIAKDSKLVGEVVEKINEFYYKDSDVSESSDIGTKYMLFGDILFVHGKDHCL
ncbi:hypothetical protein JTB14_012482 [Gonioctena quinquepunctata]|nr:hypothetical protein JTB14_012482 [Gonioctena quinquepunctata]